MYTSFNARAVGLSLPASETIAIAAEAGFEGVDLMVRDLLAAGEDPAELRRRMDDLGLRGGAFPLPVAWKGDADAYRRDLADLPRLAEAAARLGLTRTGTWVLPAMPLRFDTEPERARHRAEIVELHHRRLGTIAQVLEGHDLRLGLEFIGAESFRAAHGEPFITSTGKLIIELKSIFGEHPNVGLLVDSFHLHAANDPILIPIEGSTGRIDWVHVADLPASASPDRSRINDDFRALPGENGAVPVARDLKILAADGYDGPVTAEPLARCQSLLGKGPREVAALVKRSLDSVWPDLRGRR